jgi:hypothetical protein
MLWRAVVNLVAIRYTKMVFTHTPVDKVCLMLARKHRWFICHLFSNVCIHINSCLLRAMTELIFYAFVTTLTLLGLPISHVSLANYRPCSREGTVRDRLSCELGLS